MSRALGGDEFAILQSEAGRRTDCRDLAGASSTSSGRRILIEGQHVVIGGSLGIARAPGDGRDPDELMMAADMALYEAKAEGRGQFCFYRAGVEPQGAGAPTARGRAAQRRRTVPTRAALSTAVRCRERRDHRLRGHALAAPERGMVPPASFIPVPRRSGSSCRWGWALRGACCTPPPGRRTCRSRSICRRCSSSPTPAAGDPEGARDLGAAAAPARPRDHRVDAAASDPVDARAACTTCAPSASRSPWTTSEPVIRR